MYERVVCRIGKMKENNRLRSYGYDHVFRKKGSR